MRRTSIATLAAALIALVVLGVPDASRAQEWPAKPVKIVVAFAPGGAADLFARLLAAEMSSTFKQQFYVENIAGSAGAIGTGQAARAQPDGYTLLIGGAGPLLTSPAINPNVGYDALRDFSHIAMIAGDGYVLISNPTSDLKTFADVRRAGSQNALTVGSPGAGSLGHLIIEQIKRKAGVQFQHVPFRSAGETMTGVLGGHVTLAIQTFSSAGEQVRAGKVVGLAVTSDERVPAFKDSPTFAELGLGEIGGVAWFWLTAPAKLSPDIVGKLNAEVRRVVKLPHVRQRFENDALVTMDVDAAALTAMIAKEVATWGPLAKDIGLRVQ
ncbi:MAG: putative tricarboxylic transport rane protein [Alphaproteobacteria bacterium]|nr:putative tricarboxylic transport rane protein [Alphaproteobacteria bacterium]